MDQGEIKGAQPSLTEASAIDLQLNGVSKGVIGVRWPPPRQGTHPVSLELSTNQQKRAKEEKHSCTERGANPKVKLTVAL